MPGRPPCPHVFLARRQGAAGHCLARDALTLLRAVPHRLANTQAERRSEHTSGAIMIGHQLFKLGARLGKGQRLNARQYILYLRHSAAPGAPTSQLVWALRAALPVTYQRLARDANDCAAGIAIAAYFGDVLHAHTCSHMQQYARTLSRAAGGSGPVIAVASGAL